MDVPLLESISAVFVWREVKVKMSNLSADLFDVPRRRSLFSLPDHHNQIHSRFGKSARISQHCQPAVKRLLCPFVPTSFTFSKGANSATNSTRCGVHSAWLAMPMSSRKITKKSPEILGIPGLSGLPKKGCCGLTQLEQGRVNPAGRIPVWHPSAWRPRGRRTLNRTPEARQWSTGLRGPCRCVS